MSRHGWPARKERIEKYYEGHYQAFARARGWSSAQVAAISKRRRSEAAAYGIDRDSIFRDRLDSPYIEQDAWQYLLNCRLNGIRRGRA